GGMDYQPSACDLVVRLSYRFTTGVCHMARIASRRVVNSFAGHYTSRLMKYGVCRGAKPLCQESCARHEW
ncbi:MAG: hypothetical protein QGI09_03915, partial [Dehalococcoidia bacterium]|nr:hypothetical protein [Dehalococcoidia bacterium]